MTKRVTHKYRGKKEKRICEHSSAEGGRCKSWATKFYQVEGKGVWWCRAHAAMEGYVDDSERRRRVKAAHAARTQQIHEMLRRLELEVFGDAGSKVMTEAEFVQMRDRAMDVMLLKKAMRGSDLALRLHYAKQGIVPAPIASMRSAPLRLRGKVEYAKRKHEEDEEPPRKFKTKVAEMLSMKSKPPPKPLTAKRALKEIADEIIDSGDAETGTPQERAMGVGEMLAPSVGDAPDSPAQGEHGGEELAPPPGPDAQGAGDSRVATGEKEALRPKSSPSPACLEGGVAEASPACLEVPPFPFDVVKIDTFVEVGHGFAKESDAGDDTGNAQPAAGGSSVPGAHDHEIKVGYDEYNESHRKLVDQLEKLRDEALRRGTRLSEKLAIKELERKIKRLEEEHGRTKETGEATLHPAGEPQQADAGVRETADQDGGEHQAQTEAPRAEEPERQSGERIPTLKELLKMEEEK